MNFFELEPRDISNLNDADLRDMVGRLCEAELISQKIHPSCVFWGGAQEAADGGLDVRVSDALSLNNSGFVPRENTGFQVKKNRMGKAACKKEMLDKGCLKSVINDLAAQKGAYVIVSGEDDCADKMLSDRLIGMQSAVENLPNKEDLLLGFYGRDRLATWLRQFPGVALWVRSKLGKPLSGWTPFGRWAATPPSQDDEFLLDDHPCVIDLNSQVKDAMPIADGIKLARDKLRTYGSVVRITGLSGVGKTRFAQALFETNVCEDALPTANVIYADLGSDLTPTASELLAYLIANDFAAYVVLDNCPPDVHRTLQNQVSSQQARLRLLTIEYDISDDRPEETKVIHIEPSSEETVSKLVQKRFPALGVVNANKVSEFAGGNARIAIALASRVDADETLTKFSDEELFQRLFNQRKGNVDSLLESAEVLSLVYSFNVSLSEFNDELSILANISGLERRTLNRNLAELLRRQLSQQRGNWRAVLPHALANRLAERALQHISPQEINNELFKRHNLRLFKSCAHRLGYLHNFEPAQQLAHTWILPGAPLHNIASCDDELLEVFSYIAPLFPDVVLIAIENASINPDFCSRNNNHFSVIVRLLRQLAYDDDHFDRASGLILRFAETEGSGEKNNSIVSQLQGLFSIYLSGTQATPVRRQAFIKRLLESDKPRYLEIAYALFGAALQTSHWSSVGSFSFGARSRDYGWEPKTLGDKLNWYIGFIGLLEPLLTSEEEECRDWAKGLLANNFRGLWSFAGCFDILEKIVFDHAVGGKWPKIWVSIKRTIYLDGDKHSPELLTRLESLECLAAPSDLYSEIEACVFTSTQDQIAVRGERRIDESKKIGDKITRLGELAAFEPKLLERLAPQLWKKSVDSIELFGKGLARGAEDQSSIFEFLISLMQEQKLENFNPVLFSGFIQGVHAKNPILARQLQERVLEIPELKPHFIYLLSATLIEDWGTQKLIELAHNKELEAWRFEQISYGGVHETISDSDLSELLRVLNDLDNGAFSTIKILIMRFFTDQDSGYIPSAILCSVGRQAILKMLSMHKDEINKHQIYGIDRVVNVCLSECAPDNEIRDIVKLLCEGVESYRLYSSEFEDIISHLVQKFPEEILDRVFMDGKSSDHLVNLLFKNGVNYRSSLLNLASLERIVKWCDGNQNRILKVATALSSYVSVNQETHFLDHPTNVVLSEHIKSLLELAENKTAIIEVIYSKTFPSSWSGSLAYILDIRSKAFAELLEHPSFEVQELVRSKLTLLESSIRENRKREAEMHTQREQRFE